MDCTETRTRLAAYALGAFRGPERSALEEHLAFCLDCNRTLQQEMVAIKQFPTLPGLSDPPARLKDRLLTSVRFMEHGPRPGHFWRERREGAVADGKPWRILTIRPLISLAFGLGVAAATVLGWNAYREAEVEDLASRNDHLASTVRHQWDAISMAGDPNVQTASFQGGAGSPDTRGSLFLHREQQHAVILVRHLDPPSKGLVYQLWLWDPRLSVVVPAGTFQPMPEGYGVWAFRPPVSQTSTFRFGVTQEPEGGSNVPTGPMLFSGDLPGPPLTETLTSTTD